MVGFTLDIVNKIGRTKKHEPLTAPKKNGGGSANINSCAINKVW